MNVVALQLRTKASAVLSEHYPEPPDAFEALVHDVMEVLSLQDAPCTMTEEGQEQPPDSRDALADLLKRVKQEVERRQR